MSADGAVATPVPVGAEAPEREAQPLIPGREAVRVKGRWRAKGGRMAVAAPRFRNCRSWRCSWPVHGRACGSSRATCRRA